MASKKVIDPNIEEIVAQFLKDLQPSESAAQLALYVDKRTGAHYSECHIRASKLVAFSTTDVPLDPASQAAYRANRDMVQDAPAFERMKDDAMKGRSFSNIVAEYTRDFDKDHPLKIIGGQHRFDALQQALASKNVDEIHGVKVYFGLDKEQRLDVQLISNTNIAVSRDLYDRLQETSRGSNLRDWCQKVGLLKEDQDFTDKRIRGGRISVQLARTFIVNYFNGTTIDHNKFDRTDTTPVLCATGKNDPQWEELLNSRPELWKDKALERAGREFSKLVIAQRSAFTGKKANRDFPEKAMSPAVIAAWAYTAGMLQKNNKRLQRHYALPAKKAGDPLNALALAEGRHKTDGTSYRGLGYRTDARERGQLVELFDIQAEKGDGIGNAQVDTAVKEWFAKQAILDARKARAKIHGED